jgi:hypothetical protein
VKVRVCPLVVALALLVVAVDLGDEAPNIAGRC